MGAARINDLQSTCAARTATVPRWWARPASSSAPALRAGAATAAPATFGRAAAAAALRALF